MATHDFQTNLPWSQREQDLNQALEHQIDVAIRLEDERLSLFKENKILKEQLNELNHANYGNSVSFAVSMDTLPDQKEINQIKEMRESMTQTEDLSEHGKNTESKAKQETDPNEALKKPEEKFKKRPVGEKMPIKSLKLLKGKENQQKPSNTIKEDANKTFDLNTSRIKIEKSNTIKDQELESLKEELASLKMENNFYMENCKSLEKERNEIKQELYNKEESLEQIQKEIGHLRNIVASNDYRVVKKLENELRKTKEANKEQSEELVILRNEKYRLEEELKNFKINLTKLRQDYEKENKNDMKLYELITESKRLEGRVKDLETELKHKETELQKWKGDKQDIMLQNEKLEEEVQYFKEMAKTAKYHAEKAIADVDTYRKMLNDIAKGQKKQAY